MAEDESVLEQKLDQFKGEMLAKFRLRADKWGKDSVTRDDFDWRGYPLETVRDSFLPRDQERFPEHSTRRWTRQGKTSTSRTWPSWTGRSATPGNEDETA